MIAFVLHMLLLLQASGDWPPVPDFATKVDYEAWVRQRIRGDWGPEDNAYDLYRQILPEKLRPSRRPVAHVYLTGFRQSWKPPLAPRPWDPQKEPEWELSYQRTKATLETFKQAATKPYCLFPVLKPDEPVWCRENLAIQQGIRLGLFVSCAEGLSESAWRMSGEGVDPATVLDTCETRCRVARQLEREPTLTAAGAARHARALAYEDLRYALHYDVFTPVVRRQAMQMLQRQDTPLPAFGHGLRGECAKLLGFLQAITRTTDSGAVAIDHQRFCQLGEAVLGAMKPVVYPRLRANRDETLAISPGETAEAILEHFKRLSELAGRGYPAAPWQSIKDCESRAAQLNAFTRQFLPATSGPYFMRACTLAEQRATRLLYALHLFHDEKGHWPQRLEELPKQVVAAFGNDPFSGDMFAYRLEKGEPFLYTVGPDCGDDGGKHNRRWNRSTFETPEGDGVFWPIPPAANQAGE